MSMLGLGTIPALDELMTNRERDGLIGCKLVDVVGSAAEGRRKTVHNGRGDGFVVVLECVLDRSERFLPLGGIAREDLVERLVALGDESCQRDRWYVLRSCLSSRLRSPVAERWRDRHKWGSALEPRLRVEKSSTGSTAHFVSPLTTRDDGGSLVGVDGMLKET